MEELLEFLYFFIVLQINQPNLLRLYKVLISQDFLKNNLQVSLEESFILKLLF